MLVAIFLVIVSFVVLIWAADRFVVGSAALARHWGVSPLLIGLTIVAIGTSAPEMIVSAVAAWTGQSDMGVGNALGSNIANIGLVLGVAALLTPIAVNSQMLRREFPLLIGITALVGLFLWDVHLARWEGVVLLMAFGALLAWFVMIGLSDSRKRRSTDPLATNFQEELQEHVPVRMSIKVAAAWIILGLILLPVSARTLVEGATTVALALGVSELVIGLTIVALGTSLPELVSAVVGVIKQHDELAVGSILGSNMFNSLAVLGLPGVIAPVTLESAVLTRDYALVAGLTLLLFVVSAGFRKRAPQLSRLNGVVFLMVYMGYLIILYQQSLGV